MLERLRKMPPEQFEYFIGQIVRRMGYQTVVTRYSKDSGIDIIANRYDGFTNRRVLIQVKRYTGTVGVSSVRDLYGVLMSDPIV
jgi:restriction system protein